MTNDYAQLEAEQEDDPKMAKLDAHPSGLEAWGLFTRLLRRPENFIVGLFTVWLDGEAQKLHKRPAHIKKLLKLLHETGFIKYDEASGGVFIIGKMERNAGISRESLKAKDNRVRSVLKVLDRLGHHPLFPKVFEHYPCLKPALQEYRDETSRKRKPATAPPKASPQPLDVAEMGPLVQCIAVITHDSRSPSETERQAWQRLRERYSAETILAVVKWACQHAFWRQHMLAFVSLAARKDPGNPTKFDNMHAQWRRKQPTEEKDHLRPIREVLAEQDARKEARFRRQDEELAGTGPEDNDGER